MSFKTPQTVRALSKIMEQEGLTQQDLATATGQSRASVGHHLTETRAIRDEHIVSYLHAVPEKRRAAVFGAWLHDVFANAPDIAADLMEADGTLLREITEWAPELAAEHLAALRWWEMMLRKGDPETAETFRILNRLIRGHDPTLKE